MEFTTGISEFNTTYNLNAIDDYNKYLKGQASFEIDKNAFEEALENAAKSYPVKDKADRDMYQYKYERKNRNGMV